MAMTMSTSSASRGMSTSLVTPWTVSSPRGGGGTVSPAAGMASSSMSSMCERAVGNVGLEAA